MIYADIVRAVREVLSENYILNAIGDAVKESLTSGYNYEDDCEDDGDILPPRTITFQAPTLQELSDTINEWAESVDAYIMHISTNIKTTEEDCECEALVLYEPGEDYEIQDWLD